MALFYRDLDSGYVSSTALKDLTKNKLLIVDDDPIIRDLLLKITSKFHYEAHAVENAYLALEQLKSQDYALVLVDYNMPGMNGLEFISQASRSYPQMPFIVMSGNTDINTAIQAIHEGAWDYITKPFRNLNIVDQVIKNALEKRQLILENQKYKNQLEELVRTRTEELQEKTAELQERNKELISSRKKIIGILSRAAEYKDFETGKHFIRVSEYSASIARGLALSDEDVDLISLASPVHDIGKIGVSEDILMKPAPLTTSEIEMMQRHCLFGYEIMRSKSLENLSTLSQIPEYYTQSESSDKLLTMAANIALGHHEHFDGKGYPLGKKREDIPLEARIVAVADVYDALSSERPYKAAWSEERCQNYLSEKSGSQFDPAVVHAFFTSLDEILVIKDRWKD